MNEMNKVRNLIRQDRLEKFGRILFDKKDLKLRLSVGGSLNLGCCDSRNKVWINSCTHEDPVKNLILQKALTLHEMGHVAYTDASVWRKSTVPRGVSNIIEDGRVEEAVSRKFPKARLYFIFLNRMILSIKEDYKDLEKSKLKNLLFQLILRESMKRTGIPQLPGYVHKFIKSKIGEDYHTLLSMTREAVNVKTEKECAEITFQLNLKLNEILAKQVHESSDYNYANPSKTSTNSLENSGSGSRQMPKEVEDELAELLESQDPEVEDSEMPTLNDIEIELDLPENTESPDFTKPGNVDGELSGLEDSNIPETPEIVFEASEEETTDDIEEIEDVEDIEDSEENEYEKPDDIQDTISSQLESIMEQVEDRVVEDACSEIRVENDIIKSGDAEADFSDYNVNPDKDFNSYTGHYKSVYKPIEAGLLEDHAVKIARQFKIIAQFGDGWIHSQTRGKLETHRLPSLYTSNSPKIFKKRDKIQGVDLCVSVLLDASGSMSGDSKKATEISYIIARALEIGKHKSEVVQFGVAGDDTYGDYDIYGLKSFRQALHYARKRFVPCARGRTPLFSALVGSQRSLSKQTSQRKVCFVVTDGYPCDVKYDTVLYREMCTEKIREMERQGIIVIGILLRKNDDKHNIFSENAKIRCKKVSDIETEMTGVLKSVLQRIKK